MVHHARMRTRYRYQIEELHRSWKVLSSCFDRIDGTIRDSRLSRSVREFGDIIQETNEKTMGKLEEMEEQG